MAVSSQFFEIVNPEQNMLMTQQKLKGEFVTTVLLLLILDTT